MIDLHIHTTASDGVYSPVEIYEMAEKLGLSAIAITDHDTLEGVQELIQSNLPECPGLLTGVEISTEPPKEFAIKGSLHLLGYRVDPFNKELNNELLLLQKARENRNPSIVKQLREQGIDISMEKLTAFAGDVQVGRAHIGRYLFEKGYVKDIEDAFKTYLGNGKPGYVEKYRVPIKTAIEKIKLAGGVPVLAHPGLIEGFSKDDFKSLFKELKEYGLEGLEVYYSSHDQEMVGFLLEQCEKFGFIATGGSDFHGYKDEGLILGKGRNNLDIPYSVYKTILKR